MSYPPAGGDVLVIRLNGLREDVIFNLFETMKECVGKGRLLSNS